MSTLANKNMIAKVIQNSITQKPIKPPIQNLINSIISFRSILFSYNIKFIKCFIIPAL